MKKLFSFLFPLFVSMGAHAYDISAGGFYYDIIGNKRLAVSYNSLYKGDAVIPETVTHSGKNYKVTKIGSGAFKNTTISSVTVPATVDTIESDAFTGCSSLKTVNIESNYITAATNRSSYTAGDNLMHIFGDQVEEYYLGGDVCQQALIGAKKVKKVTTSPEKTTEIGHYAFTKTQVNDFTITKNVKKIGRQALSSVKNLTINSQYFCNNKSEQDFFYLVDASYLQNITFGPDVTSISNGAFSSYNFRNEKIEFFPKIGSVDLTNVKSVSGDVSFFRSILKLTIGSGTDLSEANFSYWNAEASGDVLRQSPIYEVVFKGDATSAMLGNVFFLSNLNTDARKIEFENTAALEDNFLCNMKKLGQGYSYNNTDGLHLTEVVLPSNLESIGKACFKDQILLESIVLPDSLKVIGAEAFAGAKSLAKMVVPAKVLALPNACFSNCENLNSVILPDSLKTVGDYAFFNCPKISSLVIPASVTSFGTQLGTTGTNLRYLKDLSDLFPIVNVEKDCFIVTKTEKRANEWRKNGYVNVKSKESEEQHQTEDINIDGKINGQDALKVYEAMKNL